MQMTLHEEQRIAAMEARLERLEGIVGEAMAVISHLLDTEGQQLQAAIDRADPDRGQRCTRCGNRGHRKEKCPL
jgi:hypothetical protein